MRSDDGALSIGQLAELTGASVRSLRYYEQHRLLCADRTSSGHRRFPPEAVQSARRIRMLLHGGLPLAVVAKILPCFADEGTALDPCVTDYLREHLTLVRGRMAELDRQRGALEEIQRLVTD